MPRFRKKPVVIDATRRYCPMCNKTTQIERSVSEPFEAICCGACGHVHRVTEIKKQ